MGASPGRTAPCTNLAAHPTCTHWGPPPAAPCPFPVPLLPTTAHSPPLHPSPLHPSRRYPGRDNEYVGGWAGGEQGLKQFVAAYQREVELNGAPAKADKGGHAPKPIAKGEDTIYVGKGRVIKDDARK